MKKYLVLLIALLAGILSSAAVADNVNEKLLRSFKETYPNAKQVTWNEMPGTYIVNFVENGIRARIIYERNGVYQSSLRYYGEEHLPPYLVFYIKNNFPEKKIFGITEVSTASSINYVVKMEDDRLYTTIKIDPDTRWEYVEEFVKAL